jgi:hypothetical protein
MRWNGFLATTIVALLACAAPAAADTFVVDTTNDATGSCSPTSCSIRQAIVSSGETPGPDTIQIPAGEYTLTNGPLQVTTAVTIAGASASETFINAAQNSRVFRISGTSVSISHLTMANGVATAADGYFGGNLLAQSSTVSLDHVRVTGGSAYSGGALGNRNGTMTIANSVLAFNTANQGGSDGGAIVNFGGDGGAAANLTLRNSTIAYHTAGNSGAISQWGNNDDTTTLESTTVAFNSANISTGGINAGQGTISVRNSLLAANTLAQANSNCGAAGILSLGHNVEDGTTCGLAATGDASHIDANLSPELAYTGNSETEVLTFDQDSPAFDVGGTCSPTDQIGQARSGACDAGAWELQAFRFMSAPAGPTNTAPTFTWTGPYPSYACTIVEAQTGGACTSPYTAPPLPDGDYTLEVEAPNDAVITHTFTIDTVAPGAPAISDQYAFTGESGATFECALNGAAFAACTSPYSTAGLAPGDYVLAVRAVDAAGNRGAAGTRSFSVAAQQPAQTPVPTATPTPTPTPTPVTNKSVAADAEGTVLIKDKSGKFVPLRDGIVPNGSEIDTKKGEVTITTSTGEKATFSDGRFKVSQSGGITTATLSEPLDCAKGGKARASAKKPKTRKLWGEGKGRFRTKGQYSAATVRGTKWLVQDTCTTTLTRVAQGVVSVRDEVKKKTVTLRKGKSYVARAKKK